MLLHICLDLHLSHCSCVCSLDHYSILWREVFTFYVFPFQLYGPQALQKYKDCLSDLRTTTLSSINAVAVALLHKVMWDYCPGFQGRMSDILHFNKMTLYSGHAVCVIYNRPNMITITTGVFALQKVFNWRVVDCDLAIGLCTLLSKTEVFKILWKVIDNTWQNYDKILVRSLYLYTVIICSILNCLSLSHTTWIKTKSVYLHDFQAVAMVGAHLCNLYSEQEERKKFLSVITDAEWGIELGKLGVCWSSMFFFPI